MHAVDGGGVFVDDFVVYGSNQAAAVESIGHGFEVFADLDAGDGGVDGWVGGAGFFGALSGIAELFGVPGIHLGSTATEPDKDAAAGTSAECGRGGGL